MPDVWGWNSGRTRGIADMFADGGYKAVVPKVLMPPFEGGTDGDGLPPDFDIANRMGDLVAWLKPNFPFETAIKPKVKEIISYLKSSGVERIGMMGFCWGGWAIAHTTANPDTKDAINCAVIAHPSIHLEDHVMGGSAVALLEKSSCPKLFLPAGNDPDVYQPEGAYFTALKKAQPKSETISFPGVQHGFVNRADLGDMSDPATKAEVERAIDEACKYFQTHL